MAWGRDYTDVAPLRGVVIGPSSQQQLDVAVDVAIGIDVAIDPRATTVSSILRHVRRGRIKSVYSLRDGVAEVMEAEALETSALVGKPLREIALPEGVIIGAVVRRKAVLKPRGTMVIERDDRVIFFALRESVKKLEKLGYKGIDSAELIFDEFTR